MDEKTFEIDLESVCGYCGNQLKSGKCTVCGTMHFPHEVVSAKFEDGKEFGILPFITAEPMF